MSGSVRLRYVRNRAEMNEECGLRPRWWRVSHNANGGETLFACVFSITLRTKPFGDRMPIGAMRNCAHCIRTSRFLIYFFLCVFAVFVATGDFVAHTKNQKSGKPKHTDARARALAQQRLISIRRLRIAAIVLIRAKRQMRTEHSSTSDSSKTIFIAHLAIKIF